MCDTLIATRQASADGVAIFGKNSDRPPNEGQHLAYFPAQNHPAGSKLKCTYIEIPQAEKTHAVLLSKPFWMWGAEIGINEHGLVIGNEAIFSKIPPNKKPALLGMDMLRAALERAVAPQEAIQIITDLLQTFGQGGNCASHGNSMYYHNSFIIADANEAWTLETVDKEWAARRITDVYTISNCYTIQDQYERASPQLVNLALQNKFSASPQTFNYAKDYSDFLFTTFGKGQKRRETTLCALEEQRGKINPETMMNILRGHKTPNPQNGITNVDVCMHAGFGPVRASQSTASVIAYLDGNAPILFATGTSAPCTSIFKPIWIDAPLPNLGEIPTAQYDSTSVFWSHERLHRATMLNYPQRIQTYAEEKNALEKKFLRGALSLQGAPIAERAQFTAECFRQAAQAEAEWLTRVEKIPPRQKFPHAQAWKQFNKLANMPPIS